MKTEHLETSGSMPDGLDRRMRVVRKQEEFESYLKLLSETRAHFRHGIECIVILYITKYKGEGYYQKLCMSCSHKEK